MWPGVTYEACAWKRDSDDLALIPKSRRRKILPTYEAAVPASITDRAARTLIETACERGILARMGNARRGAFYQAPDLIAVLEEASSLEGIRRIAAR